MTFLQLFILFLAIAVLTHLATSLVLKYLRHKAILDHPNDRSSHSIPTPRGGGIGILLIVWPALLALSLLSETPISGFLPVLLSALVLAGLSWIDDLHTLGPSIRFLIQIACVTICLFFLPNPENGYLGGFLPIVVEKIILALGWIWFINLFNFMDGIDGISGVEISSIGLGLVILCFLLSLKLDYAYAGAILAGGAVGFLPNNWHKAKVFMGDVGSVPLGFILGWLLIMMAADGSVIAAILISLYYLCDATITLVKRALRKEKIWEAHREHFYQKATQGGLSHDQVALRILFANVILIGASVLVVSDFLYIGIALAAFTMTALLFHFSHTFKKAQS